MSVRGYQIDGTFNIQNGSVQTDDLADNAVQTAKILNSAVTTAKINNGAVTPDKIFSPAAGEEVAKLFIPGGVEVQNSSVGEPTFLWYQTSSQFYFRSKINGTVRIYFSVRNSIANNTRVRIYSNQTLLHTIDTSSGTLVPKTQEISVVSNALYSIKFYPTAAGSAVMSALYVATTSNSRLAIY